MLSFVVRRTVRQPRIQYNTVLMACQQTAHNFPPRLGSPRRSVVSTSAPATRWSMPATLAENCTNGKGWRGTSRSTPTLMQHSLALELIRHPTACSPRRLFGQVRDLSRRLDPRCAKLRWRRNPNVGRLRLPVSRGARRRWRLRPLLRRSVGPVRASRAYGEEDTAQRHHNEEGLWLRHCRSQMYCVRSTM